MQNRERTTRTGVGGALAALVGVALQALLMPGSARATIRQQVIVSYEASPSTRIDDSDAIKVPPDPALRTISAAISGPLFRASGSVGVFGNLGVAAEALIPGTLLTQVNIFSDEFVNPFSTPQHARANFIIDGGSLAMFAGDNSLLSFQLALQATIHTAAGAFDHLESFVSNIELEQTSGRPAFQTFGPSLARPLMASSLSHYPSRCKLLILGSFPGAALSILIIS